MLERPIIKVNTKPELTCNLALTTTWYWLEAWPHRERMELCECEPLNLTNHLLEMYRNKLDTTTPFWQQKCGATVTFRDGFKQFLD